MFFINYAIIHKLSKGVDQQGNSNIQTNLVRPDVITNNISNPINEINQNSTAAPKLMKLSGALFVSLFPIDTST